MVRIGLGVIVFGVLLYFVGMPWVEAPPGTGANIGAGFLVLVVGAISVAGVVLTIKGAVRHLLRRRDAAQ